MHGNVGHIIWAVCYLVVLFGLSLYGLHRYEIVYLFLKHRKNAPKPQGEFTMLPKITVQLPVYNEYYVIERLIKSVSELDYPKELLQIQVLDDSTDDTTIISTKLAEELKAEGFNIEVIHRDDRTGYKAGALEEGLKTCEGEFILILDADFLPSRDMLLKTVHYFTDPKVGMIQTRWGHINRTYSLLTRVQAMFLDGHLLLEQTARSRSGRFFNFNGTAGLWRRSCIETSGGWQHDTLTEDLDLSYRAQLEGWKFVFLPDLVTPAELPVDMNGFKSQQHRWTKGSIQTCKKILPTVWRSKLPFLVKLEATAHLTSNFAYLLLIFLCVMLNPMNDGLGHGQWRPILLDIPIFIAASLSSAVFYFCAQRVLYPKGWIKEIMLFPLLLGLGIGLALNNARAVLEAVFNHQSEFTRTPKYGIDGKSKRAEGTKKWRTSRYIPLKSLLPFLELGFALYFTYFVVIAFRHHLWLSLPFLILFQGGFGYVALTSFAQWLPRVNVEPSEPADALPA
jgi:cellulose synthase/poly-beta-1,6-N-acetylglucosamine synthase-like glycosyltransferase